MTCAGRSRKVITSSSGRRRTATTPAFRAVSRLRLSAALPRLDGRPSGPSLDPDDETILSSLTRRDSESKPVRAP
jgi:hypothetical protein